MLRSTALDSDIKCNTGNEHDIFPTLLEFLQKIGPHLAKQLGESYKIEWGANISTEQTSSNTGEISDIRNAIVDRHGESGNEEDTTKPYSTAVNISEENQQINDQIEISTPSLKSCPSDANGILRLSAWGITCHNCRWKEYMNGNSKETSEFFYLILTEAPPSCRHNFLQLRGSKT